MTNEITGRIRNKTGSQRKNNNNNKKIEVEKIKN